MEIGPHPNPGKAAEGRKLHGYAVDPIAAPIVRRIFREYVEGKGLAAIASALNGAETTEAARTRDSTARSADPATDARRALVTP